MEQGHHTWAVASNVPKGATAAMAMQVMMDVRVKTTELLNKARTLVLGFRQGLHSGSVIGVHTVAPVEVLPCVWSNGMPLGCALSYWLTL
jgi:hypothetical protein